MARLSFFKLVYRKDYNKMIKAEYKINRIVDNDYDPMLLELESIGYGNKLFVELNETTITPQLQLDMIKAYFDGCSIDKSSLDNSEMVLRAAIRHYISFCNESELHAVVKFDDNDYTIQDINDQLVLELKDL